MKGMIGINLEGLSYYSRGLLYADAMLSAQAFYQGVDSQGNPTRSGEQVIVFSNGTPGQAGTYKFRAKGNVVPVAQASYATVQNLKYDAASGYTTADVVITAAQLQQLPQIALQFNEPANSPATPVGFSGLELWRPGAKVGDLFYQPFVSQLAPFSTIRFMDALATNNSTLSDWSQRPVPGQRNYTTNGIPLEHAVTLCKQTGKDGWLHLPYLVAASPNGITQFAQWLATNVPLDSQQSFYVEVSNEVWNSAFAQWKQNQAAAALNPAIKYDGMGDPNILGWRQYAYLSAQLSKAIAAAYGKSSWRDTPIRPVLAVQWANPQVALYALQYVASQLGAPADFFYGLAQAPYCTLPDGFQWTPQITPEQIVAALVPGNACSTLANQNHAYARRYNLHSLAYEFGFDFGQNPTGSAARASAQQMPTLADVLHTYLSNWTSGGGELANWYNLTYASGNSGNWGLLEDLFTPSTVKMQEIVRSAPLMWWDDTPLAPTTTSPAAAPPPLFSGQATIGSQKVNVQITAA